MSGGRVRRRSRVIRLRRWLLGAGVVFAGILVVFIGVARYRARRAILNLPRQLGIDIKSETNGFTITRALKGHTQVVLHAAKAIQHQDGKTTLHDVAITIYGAPGSNRVDSIRGGEFDYDQNNGVLRAMGETVLDVEAPAENGTPSTKTAKRLTVHAKGLVVLEKLGVASTRDQIRFEYGATRGEALGADYERDTGVIRLYHDVHLHSDENGHVEQIDADSAEIQEQERTAVLHKAKLHDAEDTLTAPLVRAVLRESGQAHPGTLQQVHASGGVSVHTSTGEQIDAPELNAAVDEQNRLRELQMQGGVRMRGTDVNATANRAVLAFANGRARHLLLDGNAHLDQQDTSAEARTLQASRIEGDLVAGSVQSAGQPGSQRLALRDLTATGGATLVFSQPGSTGRIERTQLSGPVLIAHAAPGTRSVQLTDLQASQGARLQEEDGSGGQRTSTSEHLVAHFSPDPHDPARSTLQSVVQDGNVDIRDTRPATRAAANQPAHDASSTQARGQHADFQANTNLLTLTGTPQVSSDGLQLAAERIVVNRETGDADATGDIRGTVTQVDSGHAAAHTPQEPTRFAAATARFSRRTGVVVLQGGKGDARLWTSSGQVEAPVIEADQRANTLHAHAAAGQAANTGTVRTVLVQSPAAKTASTSPTQGEGTTRIFSRELVYSSNPAGKRGGTADFRGGIRLLQGADTITADNATAQLAGGTMLTSAGVDTITAQGHVRIVQTDRTVTGDKLVYTAATRRAVLTGSPGAPPVARDATQGTVSGTQLMLLLGQHAGDNTVQVTGTENAPVRTELDLPERSGAGSRSRSKRKSGPTP